MFKVGISDVVPKTIAHRLLAPTMNMKESIDLCRENGLENLLAELALHRIDMVLSDDPFPGYRYSWFQPPIERERHQFFGKSHLIEGLSDDFPKSLSGQPLLSDANRVHDRLLGWLEGQRIYPNIVGEFDDSALMKVFGEEGGGLFISQLP